MENEIKIRRMPARKTLEEFLQGMEGEPTVVFNKETGQFHRKDDDRPLCQICGEAMVIMGIMAYCQQDRVYFPKD